MTVTDQMWARGASAPVTLPPAPAPPAPPTYFPPTAEGGRPGRGPRRRFPRWIAATVVLVAVAAAGIGGWALRGATNADPVPPPAAPTAAPSVPPQGGGLSPEQAKAQTCGAYKTLGTQWSGAYQKWLAALPQPWSWSDPVVKTATAEFDATATAVASQLAQLTAPNAPTDVTNAVRDVRLQIVDLAASHGQTGTGAETDAKLDAVDAAMATANRACGL